MSRPLLAFALDVATLPEALSLAEELAPEVDVLKIGLELFVAAGREGVMALSRFGVPIFLDLKLHDIPHTVASAVAAARDLGVRYLTVHASGGPAMLEGAVSAAGPSLSILAVTVLTSIGASELSALGLREPPTAYVERWAGVAESAGVFGVVASVLEAHTVRSRFPRLAVVTPGIRPAGSSPDDQARTATPAEAARAGAHMVVVGRPIRTAPSRVEAARSIRQSLQETETL